MCAPSPPPMSLVTHDAQVVGHAAIEHEVVGHRIPEWRLAREAGEVARQRKLPAADLRPKVSRAGGHFRYRDTSISYGSRMGTMIASNRSSDPSTSRAIGNVSCRKPVRVSAPGSPVTRRHVQMFASRHVLAPKTGDGRTSRLGGCTSRIVPVTSKGVDQTKLACRRSPQMPRLSRLLGDGAHSGSVERRTDLVGEPRRTGVVANSLPPGRKTSRGRYVIGRRDRRRFPTRARSRGRTVAHGETPWRSASLQAVRQGRLVDQGNSGSSLWR